MHANVETHFRLMVLAWIAMLILAPFLIISSFHEQDALGLGIGIAATMFVYFITGIFLAIDKGWGVEKETRKG